MVKGAVMKCASEVGSGRGNMRHTSLLLVWIPFSDTG